MKNTVKGNITLFSIGGVSYGVIELIWRRYTHWTMVITGGVCFVLLYRIFKKLVHIALWKKCIIGSSLITFIEFISGCIVNLWGKLEVWDYSDMPANFLGQICLYYSILWGLLTIPIAAVCKMIRKMLRY